MHGSHNAENRGRVRGSSRTSIMSMAFLAGLAHSTPVLAQSPPTRDTPVFLVGIEGRYGSPQRAGAGAELFLPVQKWHCEDGLCGGQAVEVQASAAMGGWRLAGGPAMVAYPLWFDALLTWTQTSATPRGASPDSKYVGVEGGFAFPVSSIRHKRYLHVRSAIGVAHRVDGAAGPDQTTFNWSIGVHYVWPKF
jgi:hypothetical protein